MTSWFRLVLFGTALMTISSNLDALEVVQSQGQAEILVDDIGWRRAVIGRTISDDTVLSTWVSSNIIAEGDGLQIRMQPLSIATISQVSPSVAINLRAGALRIMVESGNEFPVTVRVDGFTIRSSAAEFELTRRSVSVVEGSVEVVDGADRNFTVEAPDQYSFVLHAP
ncbi:MAG: hypothetical protein ACOC4F_04025 [bacterium]